MFGVGVGAGIAVVGFPINLARVVGVFVCVGVGPIYPVSTDTQMPSYPIYLFSVVSVAVIVGVGPIYPVSSNTQPRHFPIYLIRVVSASVGGGKTEVRVQEGRGTASERETPNQAPPLGKPPGSALQQRMEAKPRRGAS